MLFTTSLLFALAQKPFSLLFGGDIMLNGIPPSARTLYSVRPLLTSAVTFANLEVPLTDSTDRTQRKTADELKRRDQFILKGSPKHIPFLKENGILVVTLGNNHAMDYGARGLDEMMGELDRARIHHTGAGPNLAESRKVCIVGLRGGVRVGLLSAMAFLSSKALSKTTPATEDSAGVSTLDFNGRIDDEVKDSLREWIADAHKSCDIVVVGVHWGTERKPVPNPYQVSLGRALVDAGADVVWGNHPHVLQGAEIYKGVPILYSMGNLISPLPAATGFVKVTFDGKRRQLRFYPARDRVGRCEPLPERDVPAAATAYRALCQAIQTKYHSPDSELPEVFSGTVLPPPVPAEPNGKLGGRRYTPEHGRRRALH